MRNLGRTKIRLSSRLTIFMLAVLAQPSFTCRAVTAPSYDRPPPSHLATEKFCADRAKARTSETCAAWSAADAGREAARWAFWQVILSGLGFAGLLYSLYLTRRATLAAAEANMDAANSLNIAMRDAAAAEELVRTAQQNAERELRAYLDVSEVRFIAHGKEDSDGESALGLRAQINNHGKTPASEVMVKIVVASYPRGRKERTELHSDSANIGVIAPGDHCGFRNFFWLPIASADLIRSGNPVLKVELAIEYRDVFDVDRHLKCVVEGNNLEAFAHVDGSRAWT